MRSCDVLTVMFGLRDLDSGGVGPCGGHHSTRAFFPPGPPPCVGYGCLLILWLHGDLRSVVASTTLSYDGVTGWITNSMNPISLP